MKLSLVMGLTYTSSPVLCELGWLTLVGRLSHAMLLTQRRCFMWAKRRMADLFLMSSHHIFSSTRVGDFSPDLPTTDADGQPLLSNKMHRISCHEKGYRVIQ